MRLDVATEELAAASDEIHRLAPWMHPYRLGDEAVVGLYKYHGLAETVFLPPAPPAALAAYDCYMAGRPFAEIDASLEQLGDDVSSLTGLDIASATGLYSFHLGAQLKSVVGVEIRAEQVQQARLLQRLSPRLAQLPVSFEHDETSADSPDYRAGEQYDIVLSKGLLYHLADPVQHIRNLRRIATRAAIINTMTHWAVPRMWELTLEDPGWITKATSGISWRPHALEVPRIARLAGFSEVHVVPHPLVADFHRLISAPHGRIGREIVRVRGALYLRRRLADLTRLGLNPTYLTYLAVV